VEFHSLWKTDEFLLKLSHQKPASQPASQHPPLRIVFQLAHCVHRLTAFCSMHFLYIIHCYLAGKPSQISVFSIQIGIPVFVWYQLLNIPAWSWYCVQDCSLWLVMYIPSIETGTRLVLPQVPSSYQCCMVPNLNF
jgi:hypothetical protein